MGAMRRIAVAAWRADDTRMRVAAWTATAAALLGIGLAWSALRVVWLYALWTIGTDTGQILAADYGLRAALLVATVVCVVVGVGRRAAVGRGKGALIAAIVLAGLGMLVQVAEVAALTHFDWRLLTSAESLSWLAFAALTVVAAGCALAAERPTSVREDATVPDATVPDATMQAATAPDATMQAATAPDAGPRDADTATSLPGEAAQAAAAPCVWLSVGAAFVAFAVAVLVLAQSLIVPDAWGPALVELTQAGVTIVLVAVQVIAALFVLRGSALARLVVSAVAVILLVDAVNSPWFVASDSAGSFSTIGLTIAAVLAVAAAVPLWLPAVSRFLAEPAEPAEPAAATT